MGRLLLQMLAMFAQFERDTIIDRVVAGMERKAAKGRWKGGRRPFGYQVDKTAQQLVVDDGEAAVVRLIFTLYTDDRLGSRAIAAVLNGRGHRTTTGGPWSGHQVVRALTNRTYLGELSFRDNTVTGTHPAIIEPDLWQRAETILAARGEDHSHRASNGSDYHLTGRLRCPRCGKAMIGTRATGRSRTYRYYTCFTRARYDTTRCDAPRLDADAVDTAVLDALTRFYRDRRDLITAAVITHQTAHRAAHADRHAELAAVTAELTNTRQATDRYLTAFEDGTLDAELVADRITTLRTRTTQLQHRADDLTDQLHDEPTPPAAATLDAVADHIADIIAGGTHNQRKALVEALIDHVKITAPGQLIPVFRIPQPASSVDPGHAEGAATHQVTTPNPPVRAMTNSVRSSRLGLTWGNVAWLGC